MSVIVREYLDPSGRSSYARWFSDLHAPAAAKVATALYRLELGNFSNVEGVGAGVYEYKIDFGPGYRIYFGKEGENLIILLGGSSKKGQQAAIAAAKKVWEAYKQAKPGRSEWKERR